jgi:hypothetical protein
MLSSTSIFNQSVSIRPAGERIMIASRGFYITLDSRQNVAVSILTASGKTAWKHNGSMNSGLNFVNRPNLANGIYVVSMTTTEGSISKRFICTDAGFAQNASNELFTSNNSLSATNAVFKSMFADTLIITIPMYGTIKKALTAAIDTTIVIKMGGGEVPEQEPCDPKANSKVRNLLKYLRTHTFISGQTNDYASDLDRINSLTGRYPAIGNFEMAKWTPGNTGTQTVINWHKSKKGIVAFQWHWNCPQGGSYSGNCDFEKDLTNSGSKLYKDIDLIVTELKKMGDAGIPVIFRPLHEANNNYMWWAKKGPDAYKKLWKLIYDRAQLAGAHNLLWTFNGMASGSGAHTPMKNWYPGDSLVDIISADYTQSAADLAICKAMGNNKVVGQAETMNAINPAKDAPWPFFIVWAARDWNSRSQSDWVTSMKDPKTISIDQLPDMTKW